MNENLKKFISMLCEEQKKQAQTSDEIAEQPVVVQPHIIKTIQYVAPQRPEPTLSGPELLAARLSRKVVVEEQQQPDP